MKKHLFKYIVAVILLLNGIIFATDIDTELDDTILPDTLEFYEPPQNEGVMLFSDTEESPSLDYSRLNGHLTVEVKNVSSQSQYSLIVVEYNADGLPVNMRIISDVKAENEMGRVSGEYEKAFLWNIASMRPACPAISTKTDYEIIEGADGDWSVSPDGHMLYSYLGEETDVIIPNSYHGKLITSIYNRPAISAMTDETTYAEMSLFGGRTDITSFTVSEGISALGPCAFSGCEASCALTLPSTLKYIGNYAFMNCVNLTGSVDLSAVTVLQQNGGFQFANCGSLDGTLTLPCVESIPEYAFYNCKKLTGGLNIPYGVKRIEKFAFSCTSAADFTALSLPETLEFIGKAAFQFQSKVSNELVLNEGLKHIGDAAFNHCGSIPNTVLTIPASLESIGGDASESNTGYGCHVFYDAFRYTSRFEVANGSAAFKAEDGVLYSIDGTRLIVYPYAKADSSFTVPEGVTQIDEMAFGHSKFETITLPDSFVISEEVPENVLNNKANTLAVAMYHYNSLQAVEVTPSNPNYISVNGILYSKDKMKLWYVPPKISGGIVIEEGCTEMMSGSCWMEVNNYSGELYTSIYIPKTVSKIHDNTLNDLNRKTDNGFTISLDSENSSFAIQGGKIVKR